MSSTIEIKETHTGDFRLSVMTEKPDEINGETYIIKSGIDIPLSRVQLEVLSAEILAIL